MKRELLDQHVIDLLLVHVAAPKLGHRGRRPGLSVLAGQVAADEARLEELAADYGGGRIGRGEWLAARTAVTARLDAARRAYAAQQGAPVIAVNLGGGDPVAAWDRLGFDRRRAVLRAAIDRIDLHPAGRNRWVPMVDRVTVTWRR